MFSCRQKLKDTPKDNTPNKKLTRTTKRARGMTLQELTEVILVLLSLISILFVGARAWKKGSDRAANVMIVRNVQQAVRSYQNMNDLKPGVPLPWDKIVGPDAFLETRPTCSEGTYTFATTIPTVGKLACTCSNPDHAVSNHEDW